MDMFGILGMMGNYEQRKVDNFKKDKIVVDTVRVTDSHKPFETGICHPDYKGGDWVIVELYDTKEEAQTGHDRWVKTMTAKKLPAVLNDVSTAEIFKIARVLGVTPQRAYKKATKKAK